ncbi:helix-turn-helix domain-containing protein [Methylobacterium organophilum]|jgi:transcriptional regulator with XRE-family HTH domain|uniref:helix-turn-helix domain-containing protein n=1 Tax=Methylobacterium organophilum TaxID=410 RepID=UPI001FED5036|nr:helix-turn-helix transcriptional regulator [Methylobacterium organophilum]
MTLAEWLKREGKTVVALAKELGRDPSFITRVKNGTAMPSVEVAAEIQRLTGGAVTAIDYVRLVPAPAAHTQGAAA